MFLIWRLFLVSGPCCRPFEHKNARKSLTHSAIWIKQINRISYGARCFPRNFPEIISSPWVNYTRVVIAILRIVAEGGEVPYVVAYLSAVTLIGIDLFLTKPQRSSRDRENQRLILRCVCAGHDFDSGPRALFLLLLLLPTPGLDVSSGAGDSRIGRDNEISPVANLFPNSRASGGVKQSFRAMVSTITGSEMGE